jgi:L-threonylcarbamoyladenylate synthase
MLSEVVGFVKHTVSGEELRRSPGTRHRHYTPRARVILIEHGSTELIDGVCREHLKDGAVGFIGHSQVAINDKLFHTVQLGNRAEEYAHSIYSALRELDSKNPRVIVVEGINDEDEGAAVMDRLRRAASELKAGS